MQNREQLRQKDHDGGRITMCQERGKNIIFRRGGGGGINIVFGPKYRPLPDDILILNSCEPTSGNQNFCSHRRHFQHVRYRPWVL
jgi:hypothetical protein